MLKVVLSGRTAKVVQMSVIEAQLTRLGVKKTWFCRTEIRELQHILMDDESIVTMSSQGMSLPNGA